jgi:adenosyl cobinamide kinase/adenosyl cobinamide phosphate guanylyltransferase
VITLVIGGVRSGKSELGARLASRLGEPVTVVVPTTFPTDPDLAARVRAHQARRPDTWTTVECGAALPATLATTAGPVLVDSLGAWVAESPGFDVDAPALLDALATRAGSTVLVTEEVGLAVHPPTESGRRFADALGALNTEVAAIADEALLTVAGQVVPLRRPDCGSG